MSASTQEAPAKKPGFFVALTLGLDGEPDEAACAFIGANIIFWAGTIFNMVVDRHFPMLDFASGEVTLISIYTAFVTARSRWRSP